MCRSISRPVHERTRDGDALLLATGELRREVMRARTEADAFEQIGGACVAVTNAAQFEWHLHILECGEGRHQLEALEHETDAVAAESRAGVLVEQCEIHSIEEHSATCRCIQTCQQAEERRLAAAGWADDCNRLTRGDIERHIAQDRQGTASAAIFFRQIADSEHGRRAAGRRQTGVRHAEAAGKWGTGLRTRRPMGCRDDDAWIAAWLRRRHCGTICQTRGRRQ